MARVARPRLTDRGISFLSGDQCRRCDFDLVVEIAALWQVDKVGCRGTSRKMIGNVAVYYVRVA